MTQKMMQDLRGDAIVARDGRIGSVQDVYFDDERWAVRYLVVDTGNWLPGRQVLISPRQVPEQAPGGEIRVDLTRDQVEHAPGIEQDTPVSRILEEAHARYYDYPFYWAGPYLWGPAPLPHAARAPEPAARGAAREHGEIREATEQRARETHLRSGAEVVGYAIRAQDGELGHVEDFLVDERTWEISGMVVDTRNWLPGKKVVVAPTAIEDIDWHAGQVSVRMTRDEVKRAAPAA